jgi:alpha-beta hydrolase superfamily lysophospholipase
VAVGVAAALAVGAGADPARASSVPVQLRTSDGITLSAAAYDAAEPTAGIVLVHMFTRSKDDWRSLAERLQNMDISALALDLRGHGGSAGSAAPTAAMALDVRAAVAFLSERVGGRAIGVVGASLGASLAIIAAAEMPEVRAVAMVSPVADYRGVRLEAAAKKYGARPLFLLASGEDPYALRTVRSLVSDATAGREQRLSSVAAHGTLLLDRDPEIAAALVDWLRRTLLF